MFYVIAIIVVVLALGILGFGLMAAAMRFNEKNVTKQGFVRKGTAFPIFLVTLSLVIFVIGAICWPYVNVWQSEMDGKAELAKAEFNRQIKVREAQAILDSAKMLADAEVLRAEGVKKANRIIADGLGGPEGYLRYLYIDSLKDNHNKEIIYIPTEAGMPILEAGHRPK